MEAGSCLAVYAVVSILNSHYAAAASTNEFSNDGYLPALLHRIAKLSKICCYSICLILKAAPTSK